MSFESGSPVFLLQRRAIWSGDHSKRSFRRRKSWSGDHSDILLHLELASALLLSRRRWTCLGRKASTGAFPSSRQASRPQLRPHVHVSFLCPYRTPLTFRIRYRVVLFLQRAAATAGMLIPTRSMALIS